MSAIVWDQRKQHLYETGVDHVVLYDYDTVNDAYTPGVAWNGVTAISLNPEGGEPNVSYADNIKYLSIPSLETLGFNIRAFTYPEEFKEHDGTDTIAEGVYIGQQSRDTFGLCYRTLIGDEVVYDKRGYMLHLIYGATASPSSKEYETKNDSPSPLEFEWDCDTTPVSVTGKQPTAIVEIDSTKVDATKLAGLEAVLYGGDNTEPRLPFPDAIAAFFAGSGTL